MRTKVTVLVDEELRAKREYHRATDDVISLSVTDKRDREVRLKIVSSTAFVPKHYSKCDDSRLLALLLDDVRFE